MKAVVVGGGVGGLTVAIALAHEGVETVVLEQVPEFTPEGSSLQLGPNAVRLLDALDLGARLRESGALPQIIKHVRWDDGRLLHQVALGDAMSAHFGAPELDFFRPDLHRVLIEAVAQDSLRMGARVVGVRQDSDGAAAVLDDGTEIGADIIVSADGVQSTIRRQLAGPERPEFSGTVVYRGVAQRDAVVRLHPPGESYYWLGPRRHGSPTGSAQARCWPSRSACRTPTGPVSRGRSRSPRRKR